MSPDVYRPSDDAAETPAAGDSPSGKGLETNGPAAVTPSEEQVQIDSLKAELQQCQDRFLRKAAEFDNYRKRMEREKGEAAQLAQSSILLEFLPIADACDRAIESLDRPKEEDENLAHYRDGVRLLYKQIHDVFSRIGVIPVKAKGEKFDPHLHEAVAREEDPQHEENTVVEEMRRGYLFKGRLLRPSQVRVAIRPHPEAKTEQ